jgi:uncharacterized protein
VFNLWLHVTNACNLACPYCYVHKDRSAMPDHVFDRTLDAIESTARAATVDRLHVRFAGGEPMLRFDSLRSFVDRAKERCLRHGVRFSAAVLSNGTAVPKGAPEWLRDNGISLSISVDGVEDVQDRMRPRQSGKGSFDLLRRGLDAYQGAGIQPYGLVTVGTSNVEGLPELVDFLLDRRMAFRLSLVRDLEWGQGVLDDRHGPDAVRPNRHVPLDRLASCDPPGMLTGMALRRVQRAIGLCYDRIEAAMERDFFSARLQPRFRGRHKFCDLEPWRPIQRACGAGQNYVAIGHDGAVSPCQAALHRDGTKALTATNLFTQAREQTQFDRFHRQEPGPECSRCAHRASCAGGCPLLLHRRDGHTDGRSPYCEVFKAVLPRIVHIAALELALAHDRQEMAHAA